VDIKQLRYFIAIAEEGSLSAASHRLRIAQPSLSQHVIKIEQELGVTLVRRSPRGITLTESGDILLRHAPEHERLSGALDFAQLLQDDSVDIEILYQI
jgi:LysR family transcriptional regulator, nitrogen assimilation regulatory protein